MIFKTESGRVSKKIPGSGSGSGTRWALELWIQCLMGQLCLRQCFYTFHPAHFAVCPCFFRTQMLPAAYANTPQFSQKTFCFLCAPFCLKWKLKIPKFELRSFCKKRWCFPQYICSYDFVILNDEHLGQNHHFIISAMISMIIKRKR